jgi:hypothetical protein
MPEAKGSRATRCLGVVLAAVLVAAGCSGGEADGAGTKGDATDSTEKVGEAGEVGEASDGTGAHECDQSATLADVTAVPVQGTPTDLTVTSFDGTELRVASAP